MTLVLSLLPMAIVSLRWVGKLGAGDHMHLSRHLSLSLSPPVFLTTAEVVPLGRQLSGTHYLESDTTFPSSTVMSMLS